MNIKDVIKLGLWLLLVFALSENCYAETIKGSVKDVNGHPMPFVTISVLDKDSTLLTGDITDEQGKYEIEISNVKSQISNFLIQASYVGYQTVFGGPDFVLREETERLAEVEVKAKKPLIERQMDKLVVNVSASAPTETIFSVVRRVCGSTKTVILP